MSAPELVELTADDTHALRRSVLRVGVPTTEVVFPEDHLPGTIHLGLRVDGALVAVSTWVPREHGGSPAVQLRGMATASDHQRHGLGGLLLEQGCARVAGTGLAQVWARARDTALAFYLRHGFAIEGEGFIDEATQLPHHLVVRRLSR